jgi:arginyl-tRNA synthetase
MSLGQHNKYYPSTSNKHDLPRVYSKVKKRGMDRKEKRHHEVRTEKRHHEVRTRKSGEEKRNCLQVLERPLHSNKWLLECLGVVVDAFDWKSDWLVALDQT